MTVYDRQNQRAGDNSVNVQAQLVHLQSGLSYTEVREVALDVFKANHHELSKRAAELARVRAEELTDEYLRKLSAVAPGQLAVAAVDPGVQVALYEAQKDYVAAGGDAVTGNMLVELLVQRSALPDRTLEQLVVTEALKVVPKLTLGQLNALTCNFVMRRVQSTTASDLVQVIAWLRANLVPFAHELPRSLLYYEHLTYAGCGYFSGRVSLAKLVSETYPQAGGQIRKEVFLVRDDDALGVPSPKRAKTDEQIVRDLLIRSHPSMKVVYAAWAEPLSRLELTTIGLAIAHANWRRVIQTEHELSLWLDG